MKARLTHRCKDILPSPSFHYKLALFHRDNNPRAIPLILVVACFICQFLLRKGDCLDLLFLFELIGKVNICNLQAESGGIDGAEVCQADNSKLLFRETNHLGPEAHKPTAVADSF